MASGAHEYGHPDHEHGHHHHGGAVSPAEGDAAECPVMKGTPVSMRETEELGLVREVDGRRYFLCCETCASLFDADPRSYTAA